MPTFTPSAPASIRALVPSAVATLPPMTSAVLDRRLTALTWSSTPSLCPWAVSTMMASTPASSRASARLRPSGPTPVAAATRKRPLVVLGRVGVVLGLFDVFDGDQADTAEITINDQQLFDAVLVQQAFGFVPATAFGHGDQAFVRHQLSHGLALIAGKAHVAVGQNTHQPLRARFNHGNAADLMAVPSASARRRAVALGRMVTGFTTMPDSYFFTA